MKWRRRRNLKKRKMEQSEIIIYLTYLTYEGIFDAMEHFKDSKNPFFIGANNAFKTMRKLYSIEDIKIFLYKTKVDLEHKGGKIINTPEGGDIEFKSTTADILNGSISKQERELWALSGAICAAEYILGNLQRYKRKLDSDGYLNKKSI